MPIIPKYIFSYLILWYKDVEDDDVQVHFNSLLIWNIPLNRSSSKSTIF